MFDASFKSNDWPTFKEITIAAILAIFITAVDIYFSTQTGLLSYPPYYDGISYILQAKHLYYHLIQNSHNLKPLFSEFIDSKTPIWQALMVLSFFIFGEGEWQAYTVRFWPVFLLLLLVIWVVRRRSGSSVIILPALTATAIMPIISPSLCTASLLYSLGKIDLGMGGSGIAYLGDLRPDLFFSILLLWAIIPLIEHAYNLDRRTTILSGVFASLAVLTKASLTPLLLVSWGIAILYTFIIHRKQILSISQAYLWAIAVFFIILLPWILAGGIKKWIIDYIYGSFTVRRILFANPHPTFFSEAIYYWKRFFLHLGYYKGRLVIGTVLMFPLMAWKRREFRDTRLMLYLTISAFIYIIMSITPNKNMFVVLPCYPNSELELPKPSFKRDILVLPPLSRYFPNNFLLFSDFIKIVQGIAIILPFETHLYC